MLIGSDTAEQVGWIDVSDGPERGQIQSLITTWDARPGFGFCFLMWKHEDVYYAGSFNGNSAARNSVISASRDLQHWAVYHRFSLGERGAFSYAGFLNGQMHVGSRIETRMLHLALPPAEIELRPAKVLSSGATNLAPPTLATCESAAGWQNLSPSTAGGSNDSTLVSVASPAYEGAGALRAARTDGGRLFLRSPSIAAVGGQTLQARFMARGQGGHFAIRWSVDSTEAGDFALYYLPRDTWQAVTSAPLLVPSGASDVRLQLLLDSTLSNRCELFLDAVMIEPGPATHYHPPGPARAADSYAVELGSSDADWTHIFSFQPAIAAHQIPEFGGELLVRRYRAPQTVGAIAADADALHTLDISFNAAAGFFTLRGTTPSGERIANFSPQLFQQEAQIRIAVRGMPEGVTVSIANGRGFEARSVLRTRWAPGIVSASSGADLGERQLPGRLFDDVIYDWRLSDDELSKASQLPNAPKSLEIEAVAIERSANGGAFEEIWRGPQTPHTFVDPSQAGLQRRVYRCRAWREEKSSRASAAVAIDGVLPADIDGDTNVDVRDAALLMRAIGSCAGGGAYFPACDLDQDGCVTPTDWNSWTSYIAD